jgi:FkbM family methyltransferase
MNTYMMKVNLGQMMLGQTKYGQMIHGGPYIGKCLELYGEYSESEVSVFRAFVKQGDYAIEVGANIGSLTLPLARLVGETGRVFAFESHPHTFNILCGNLALNDLKNVKPVNAFVAHDTSINTASPQWGELAFVSDIWETTFFQIDQIDLPRLEFIKVDVDGNELEVLKSGVQTIQKFKPIIYFENDIQDKSPALFEWILGMGYRLYFHLAPIFSPENFYGNPSNAWAPQNIFSLMMLAVPQDKPQPVGLREVTSPGDWWE